MLVEGEGEGRQEQKGKKENGKLSISSFRERCCKVELAHATFDHSRAGVDFIEKILNKHHEVHTAHVTDM